MRQDILKRWSTKPYNAKLIKFLIDKTKDARSPICFLTLSKEFIASIDPSNNIRAINKRIDIVRSKVYSLEDLDTETKVKLLFALSVCVNKESIKSSIEGTFRFDEKGRITYYKSMNGVLELEGDHTPKKKEGSQCFRKSVRDYFEKRGKPNNENLSNEKVEKQDTEKFIGFIFKKCKTTSSPFVHAKLAAEYNAKYGLTICETAMRKRIAVYCQELQSVKCLDMWIKVNQLFGLGAKLTNACFAELEKNALVRLDHRNRIIEYKSNDGSLSLQKKHDGTSMTTANRKSNRRHPVRSSIDSGDENSDGEQNSDENSDDDIDSDVEDHLTSSEDDEDGLGSDVEETGGISKKSAAVQEKNKRLSRRRISNSDASDSEDYQSASEAVQTSRSGRLLKKRNLDAHSSHDQVEESAPPVKSQSEKTSSLPSVKPSGQTNNKRKTVDTTANSLKRSKKSTISRVYDLEDYDPNHSSEHSQPMLNGREDVVMRDEETHSSSISNERENFVTNDEDGVQLDANRVKLEVFRGSLIERADTIKDEDDDIQVIAPSPKNNDVPPRHDDGVRFIRASENARPVAPLKQEPGELVEVKKEAEEEDVKPAVSSNRTSVLQVLQALRTLAVSLDNTSESFQEELEEKIKRFEGSGTTIRNSVVGWTMELCFTKMTDSSFICSSESSKFIKLDDFMCYLKSFILNMQIEELKSVLEKVKECKKRSSNKTVRVQKVEEILRVTLNNFTV